MRSLPPRPLPSAALLLVLLAAGCAGIGRSSAPGPFPVAAFRAPIPTALPAPTRLVIYGDSRKRHPLEVWREDATCARLDLVRRIAAERPALVVHSGDLVRYGDDAAEWAGFDAEIAPIREAGIPFLPIAGNHEFVGDAAAARALYDGRFPTLLGRRFHDVRAGGLLLLLVDTNGADLTPCEIDEQDRWLRGRLAAADGDPSVRWVLIVGHHPAMTNACLHGPDAFTQAHVTDPALAHAKFAGYVCGHVHAYERFAIRGRAFVVAGGGGAPRVEVRRGFRMHDEFAGPCVRPFHFLRVTVEPTRCRVEAVMRDERSGGWAVGDAFDLDAPPVPGRP